MRATFYMFIQLVICLVIFAPVVAQQVEQDSSLSLRYTSTIRTIFEDGHGNFWFGSNNEGVCKYDGSSLEYFTVNNGLKGNQVLSIQEDLNGVVWFETLQGISYYDGNRMQKITTLEPNSLFGMTPVWEKKENDLWFGAGIKEGVYHYDGQNLSYLDFPISNGDHGFNVYSVTDFSSGTDDVIWFATYAGVIGYDGNDFEIINDASLGITDKEPPVHVRSVLADSKNRLWIGNNGIGVLLKQGDSIVNFSAQAGLIHPESAGRGDQSPAGTMEHVFVITEDVDGNIWFGDRDTGVWRYDGSDMKNFPSLDDLENTFAYAIYLDHNNVLWFGMQDGSVFTFDGETFTKRF